MFEAKDAPKNESSVRVSLAEKSANKMGSSAKIAARRRRSESASQSTWPTAGHMRNLETSDEQFKNGFKRINEKPN